MNNGGTGTLHEGRPWKRVEQEAAMGIPLLLGNASRVEGVEWVATIQNLVVEEGRTACTFKNLRKIPKAIPLHKLLKASNHEPLNDGYIRPYVPCLVSGHVEKTIVETLQSSAEPKQKRPRITDYVVYHNSDTQGGPPDHGSAHFSIYTSKNISNLANQRVWLISGEGKNPKKYFLEYEFTASRTTVDGAEGTQGTRFNPHIPLNGLPWFESFKKTQFFSLGPYRIDETIQTELTKLAETHGENPVNRLTTDDYYNAIQALKSKFTNAQVEMLVGHANAENCSVSTRELASLVGYNNRNPINLHYGKLAERFIEYFGIQDQFNKNGEKKHDNLFVLATINESRNELGHIQLKLRQPLWEALRKEWPDLILGSLAQGEVDGEITDKDKPLLPTERATMIQARIGQGNYRRKLLDLWNGQCALTGCDVEEVLRASHAKPWKTSNNQERLDPYNGLLLAAHVDALFDTGLIGFSDTGKILLSEKITPQQLKALGIETSQTLRFVNSQHHKYLAANRKKHELK